MRLFGFLRKKEEKPLRQQLLEAKAKVERELFVLATGSVVGDPSGNQSDAFPELQRVLADIKQQLAELGPEDA